MGGLNILLACSGSVATVKLCKLIEELQKKLTDCNIKVILTQRSKHFLINEEPQTSARLHVYSDQDEWDVSYQQTSSISQAVDLFTNGSWMLTLF